MKPPYLPTSLRTGRFPLLGAALMFGGGILLGDYLLDLKAGMFGLLAVLFLGLSLLLGQMIKGQIGRRKLAGIMLLTSLFFLGIWRTASHYAPNQSDYFGHRLTETDLATSLVEIEEIKVSDRSVRLVTKVLAIATDSTVQKVSGKLLVYLPITEKSVALLAGDQLWTQGDISAIQKPKNPHAFNAKSYWGRKNIFLRKYLNTNDSWRVVGVEGWRLRRFADQLRNAWQRSLKTHLQGAELAVASALLLGKKDLLDQEIRTAYADTGAIHVLAVSGLHVGIVNILVGLIFSLFKSPGRRRQILQVAVTLLSIWGFALLTGFSPSVQRAALMFSLVAIGRLGGRKTHLINSLAAAAICILALDPWQLFQPGFQLSFAAVGGIALFQKWLESWLKTELKIAQLLWSGVSVSIAATLGTLPFSLFYFHQFPLYFMFTGSLVVLTAFGIMILGIAHGLLFSILPVLSAITGPVLHFLVSLQNGFVFLGQQLPGARQETAWINAPQLWLLLGAILLFGVWLRSRRFGWIMGSLLVILVCLSFGLQSSKAVSEQQRTIAFSLRSGVVLDIIHGRKATRFMTAEVSPIDVEFATKGHQAARQYQLDTTIVLGQDVTAFTTEYLRWSPPLLMTSSGRWLWLDQPLNWPEEIAADAPPKVDFILVSSPGNYQQLLRWPVFTEQTQIVASDRFFRLAKEGEQGGMGSNGKRPHNLSLDGALVLDKE